MASFPIAFTLAILANGLLASLIKERCAHDLSHCTVSADGVMYAALFLMLLGLVTWNVHVLGRGCLVAALAFMLACAVASVSMSIDVLSEQHMELARSPFQNAAMSCCNGLVVGFLGRFSVQRHQMLACMRLCVGLHAFATVVTVVRSGNRTALIVSRLFSCSSEFSCSLDGSLVMARRKLRAQGPPRRRLPSWTNKPRC